MSEVGGQRANKCQTQKGITLIALIITVIILLILAGTAISISINGGDLFGRSQNAVAEYNNKVAEEENKINEVWSILNSITVGNDGDSVTLPAGWQGAKLSETTPYVEGSITVDGTQKTVKAPIPKGYTASTISTEDEISEGLVIYQGTEAVDANSATSRNQFVWIPVPDINSMVMCKDNNKTEGTGGTKTCNIEQQTDGSLKCLTHNKTAKTDFCGRLYGVDSVKDNDASNASGKNVYKTSMSFTETTKASQTYTQDSDYREPDLVTDYDNDENTSYMTLAGVLNSTALKTQMQDDFYDMAKSVATYGGFYVGRYEAGYDSSTYTSKKGQVVMNASETSGEGANMWYGLYKHLRKASTENDALNSQMIWGCQYDQVIKFIGNEAQIVHTDRNLPGTNGSSDYRASGATPLDIMKNIYDLEGNYFEWTEQAYSTDLRAGRGGDYDAVSNSVFLPASHRYSSVPNDTTAVCYSSRPGLYL